MAEPVVRIPDAKVALSTASVYPESTATAFEIAARLGYDGVEVMVWTDPVSQDIEALRSLSDYHRIPILAVHAPCLLITQRVWSTDPWVKLQRAQAAAEKLGASTVVVHPPFRWQRQYARDFVSGIWRMANETDVRFAVENMYPWRYRDREMLAYAPDWDVTKDDYRHFTIDLSHTATARTDALQMIDRMGGPARPRPPRRRQGLRQGRAPRPRPRHPALRRAAGTPRPDRLRRPCRHRGQHPARHVERRTRGRPRRGPGLHPAAPGLGGEGARAGVPTGAPPVNEVTARRRGRPRRTEQADTRERILGAAREEFSERGYEKTSVRGIAKAAGVDPALVHHYFGTKEQVFEAAIEVAFAPALTARTRSSTGPARRGRRAPDPLRLRALGEPGDPRRRCSRSSGPP